MINLGHDLGLKIIAEGVEDEPTLNRLGMLGCDLAQGYHLSRPMPADSFQPWLELFEPVAFEPVAFEPVATVARAA